MSIWFSQWEIPADIDRYTTFLGDVHQLRIQTQSAMIT